MGLRHLITRLWIIGGLSNETTLSDIWSTYDGNTWTLVTNNTSFGPRYGQGVANFNGKLWVTGGSQNNIPMNDVWSSDNGASWTLVTSHAAFSPRFFHGTAVFNNRLWVIGGSGDTNDVWSSADGVNWTLEIEHAEFSPRHGMGIVVYDNRLWVIGGSFYYTDALNISYMGETSDVWSSSDGVIWTLVNPSSFEPREFCPVIVYDNKIWVVGGGSFPFGLSEKYPPPNMYNNVWSSSNGKNWTLTNTDAGFSPRYGQSVIEFNNTLWLIGGYDNSNVEGKNDVWAYQSPNQTLIPNNGTREPQTLIPNNKTSVTVPSSIINKSSIPTKAGVDPMTSIIFIFSIFGILGYRWGKN